jgi:chromosome segregation ATPase
MKKRAIVQQVAELRTAVTAATAKLDQAGLDDLANKLAWLHERVDLLATRLENMRGNITLDDAAAQRLTYQVGQFSARLDRLEQPRRKRPRVTTSDKPPATPNGAPDDAQP